MALFIGRFFVEFKYKISNEEERLLLVWFLLVLMFVSIYKERKRSFNRFVFIKC